MAELEHVPHEEAIQIENVVRLTIEQLKKRYPGTLPVLRGVHPKDHGCVTARFTVHATLPAELRVGVFAVPGREYDALIRFSNADVLKRDDSPGGTEHGSRGMAVKLLRVSGTPLVPPHGPLTQDFLMINQPVFAFSNVEDYEVLSQILLKDNDDARRFFVERIHRKTDGTLDLADASTRRALTTAGIVKKIKSLLPPTPPGSDTSYQPPPASPVDNRYFSASPYLFGDDRAMKFSANPVAPVADPPDLADPNYLRTALRKRLTKDVVFDFLIQVRSASELAGKIDKEIEDACFEWPEQDHKFQSVATITISAQDFETAERSLFCENLTFTPWHGIAEHRPLGGINRLRRAVYEASTQFRHLPKEPA